MYESHHNIQGRPLSFVMLQRKMPNTSALGVTMENAQSLPQQSELTLSIDSIKQDFIQLNARQAANEQFPLTLANDEQVRQVKVWVQDQERELGKKVRVVAGKEALPLESASLVLDGAPGLVLEGEYLLFANCITTHKQAMDAYEYVVVGLCALPNYLGKSQSAVCASISNSLNDEQNLYINKRFKVDKEQPKIAVMSYLAEVAALAITPTFLQRRESWQRSWVRKLYPALAWTGTDIHYLIHRARFKG